MNPLCLFRNRTFLYVDFSLLHYAKVYEGLVAIDTYIISK